MSLAFSLATMRILQALFGYRVPGELIEEPKPDAATEYAHRAGCRLGANGEWIARDHSSENGPDE